MPGKNDRVAIVDDVFTMGTSMTKIIKALSKTKAKVVGGYVAVNREEVSKFIIPIKSLLIKKDLTF